MFLNIISIGLRGHHHQSQELKLTAVSHCVNRFPVTTPQTQRPQATISLATGGCHYSGLTGSQAPDSCITQNSIYTEDVPWWSRERKGWKEQSGQSLSPILALVWLAQCSAVRYNLWSSMFFIIVSTFHVCTRSHSSKLSQFYCSDRFSPCNGAREWGSETANHNSKQKMNNKGK